MSVFNILSLFGGLAMFLFGMSLMGSALEKRAGSRLKTILGNITSNPFKGFLLGLFVTAIIQSSSATTVMVVGFVNSGVMTLGQSIGVIMGANLGTSVTSWILSLSGIQGESLFIQLLKPSSFTPVLAFIGIIMFMFMKSNKKKDTGMILLGFAVLMFGMEAMSGAVAPLSQSAEFTKLLTLFANPILGVLVGTIFTAVIQSSSASVGVLQALTMTGSVSYATAVPIIMGQNIGTCVSAMISSIGASKNARRAAVIHLLFNLIATAILLPAFYLVDWIVGLAFVAETATPLGIAVVHTAFKLLALALLLPFTRVLEKLSMLLVREDSKTSEIQLLDDRLLTTPSVAIERCKIVTVTMAEISTKAMFSALDMLDNYNEKTALMVREYEDRADKLEDKLGSYLVKLSAQSMAVSDSAESAKLLHLIGDFERISDYAVDILRSAEEISDRKLSFSNEARHELSVMRKAIVEVLELSLKAFKDNDLDSAVMVEPLEQVVDHLREQIKKQHIARLQRNECTIELGFILSDITTTLGRVSDHCSNIAGCIIEMSHESMDMHEYLQGVKSGSKQEFNSYYDYYKMKYTI